jgi:hypothetical protein
MVPGCELDATAGWRSTNKLKFIGHIMSEDKAYDASMVRGLPSFEPVALVYCRTLPRLVARCCPLGYLWLPEPKCVAIAPYRYLWARWACLRPYWRVRTSYGRA